jgi:Alpha-2,8-polysialyltransferase (POLYST)
VTQIFYSSTLFGTMTLAAAMDAGRFGAHTERRVLLVSNNAAIPEITPALDDAPGFASLRPRFDEVVSWNDIVAPLHPSEWIARAVEIPMLERLIRSQLSIDSDPSELVLESIAVPPARTLSALIRDCPITVYSDGLMSYGPTRDPVPLETSSRITRLLHLDLVPDVTPLLLREAGVAPDALPGAAFRRVLDEQPEPGALSGTAMILGQYLSALDIVTPAEEAELYADMLRALVAQGHQEIAFKPHPAAGRSHVRSLRAVAASLSAQLRVVPESVPAEVCFRTLRPELVAGCFSTALVTASQLFGIPVATMGGELMLERLTPYQNSNRIPATIVDASFPRLARDGTIYDPPPVELSELTEAVGYCMQPDIYPALHEAAGRYVEMYGPSRYFKKRRLTAVGLLAPPPTKPTRPATPPPSRASALRRLRRAVAR